MANKYFISAYNICKFLVDLKRVNTVTALFVEYDRKQITIEIISTNLMHATKLITFILINVVHKFYHEKAIFSFYEQL